MRACVFLIILSLAIGPACTVRLNPGDTGNAKTISVAYFPNNAALVQPVLSQALTEDLRSFFQTQSRLSLVAKGGDLQIEGSITDYKVAPVSVTDISAASNRLTITVSVRFTNTQDPTKDFESNFSRFADFPASQNLVSIEAELIRQINQQLAQDIFNKALINW